MRTTVYVDGFNLYYRILKDNPEFKWINVKALAQEVLDPANVITAVNYYTARVKARGTDPDAPRRQQIYFDALATVPEIRVIRGNFSVNPKYASLAPPPPNCPPPFLPWPNVVRIIKTEEKGSDVNLGSHLVRDAFLNTFDVAVVITNDTDLIEPIRIAKEEVGKVVGLICPSGKAAKGLKDVASFVRHINHGHLSRAQFPNPIHRAGDTDLLKPLEWVAAVP